MKTKEEDCRRVTQKAGTPRQKAETRKQKEESRKEAGKKCKRLKKREIGDGRRWSG